MKKIIAIVVLSLCCISMVMAQGQGTFRAGLRIGPNFSHCMGCRRTDRRFRLCFPQRRNTK